MYVSFFKELTNLEPCFLTILAPDSLLQRLNDLLINFFFNEIWQFILGYYDEADILKYLSVRSIFKANREGHEPYVGNSEFRIYS